MRRCFALRASVSTLSVFLLAAACSGIMEETQPPLAGDPDAAAIAPDADPQAPDADPSTPDAEPSNDPACYEPASSIGSGYHRPGETCLPCHRGGSASEMTLAGTLYVDAAGSAPLAGATIHLVDANGDVLTFVTTDNGNFWASDPIAFPVRAYASLCPDIPGMANLVESSGADCNSCHGAGSRIHVP